MDATEVKSVMKSLEKAGDDPAQLLDLLNKLDKELKPSEKLLRETRIGVQVNKYRGHENAEVSNKVKTMINRWKEEVKAKKKHSASSTSSQAESPATATAAAGAASTTASSTTNNKPENNPTKKEKFQSNKPRTAANDGVKTDIYDDKPRNKCVQLFYDAMAQDSEAPPADILQVARGIEQQIFKLEKGTTAKYREKFRSLYTNLKDAKNPNLRANVVNGDISPERICKMTPQEMASDELKKEMEQMEKQNLFKAQAAQEKRAITNRFTCGKCKNKSVSYYQMQTRSADEPLTTFCTCTICDNRWKFS